MTSETEGDFSGLSRELDFFGKTGMMVNVYVRGEYRDVPAWFYERYNDYKMVDPAGKPVGSQICFQHEGFRRLIDGYVRRVARAARDKNALLMYSTYDEFGPRGWGCFCPRCVRKYREYLRAKYGEVGALNRAWQSAYASWEQVDAPRTQSFDANYGEWQRYRAGVLRDFGLVYYRALKEEDPDHPRWIDINMDWFRLHLALGRDLVQADRHLRPPEPRSRGLRGQRRHPHRHEPGHPRQLRQGRHLAPGFPRNEVLRGRSCGRGCSSRATAGWCGGTRSGTCCGAGARGARVNRPVRRWWETGSPRAS